jgi:hypothetical protein
VGLIMLSALHVSQARELKRLREWVVPQEPAMISPRRSDTRIGTRAVVVTLVGLLVLTYGVTQLVGDDSDRAQVNHDSGSPKKPKRAAVNPANVTVAVLNGTTVPGLAAALRDEVAAAGFKKGTIDTYSDQQLATSVVQYAPGRQAEAKAVSRSLGITEREPVTTDSRALVGDATVIVIAGADKAP